ncbi:acetyl-CoA hydrolase/transferase C-terminal domain-containing protein [Desulfoluna sp.]|uniref:acetyl-CoA hydrolase/transferase C-terminal domain-containing protein n=1 Tax=Desulfoluna sp. TaxID=2045199 RepID=UPI00260E3D8C|nr:acetyl-CoA hydrolase/transferase C-terminal domain-containing protein [Desulfoluna sp.]
MEPREPVYYADVERCVDDLIAKVGKKVGIAIPLAVGKPNHLVNALYRRLKTDPEMHLKIVTAVSLEKPTWTNDLERRFLQPIVERIWGDFPDFEYVLDLRKNEIPKNFELVEFYSGTAQFLNCPHAQQHYLGSNYTHAIRDALIQECNVAAQLVTKKEIDGKLWYSLGTNPDTHLDGAEFIRTHEDDGIPRAMIGQMNTDMPFMYGDAKVDPGHFDMVIENPDYEFKLFSAPKEMVNTTDWMIGLNASVLVKDGGTLQVGIGSLGDAIVAGIMMRHMENEAYRSFLTEAGILEANGTLIKEWGGVDVFDEGIMSSTEMFVDTLLDLYQCGVIKRKVYENLDLQLLLNEGAITDEVTPEMVKLLLERDAIRPQLREKDVAFLTAFGVFKKGIVLDQGELVDGEARFSADLSDAANLDAVLTHCLGKNLDKAVVIYAGFFVGPKAFYDTLKSLPEEELKLIDMRSVAWINQLYGDDYQLRVAQRKHGRYINAALMTMLNGATVADGLEDHRIISGPGGQYNFIAMAHAIPDGRAVTMIRSTRGQGAKATSNIVWQYNHTTVPRHLRDIVVTEYGIADLRGRQDHEVMTRLICIADSRFQDELLAKAKAKGKVPAEYQLPEKYRHNTPEKLEKQVEAYRSRGFFKPFPFGTDFTEEEIVLGKALKGVKSRAEKKVAMGRDLIKKALEPVPDAAQPYLKRLSLDAPKTFKEKMLQKVVLLALEDSKAI